MASFYGRLLCAAAVFTAVPLHAVTISTVPIGNPSNLADMRYSAAGYSSVPYLFRIGKTEVANSQYAEFLNAVAASDPYSLWNNHMGDDIHGGIVRSGSPGSYTYAVKSPQIGQGPGGTDYAYGNKPVAFVSWYDALRFANWLHNGQGSGSTETGAYTLLGNSEVPDAFQELHDKLGTDKHSAAEDQHGRMTEG